jgi:PhoPQ-activated pathogenicity-related protein
MRFHLAAITLLFLAPSLALAGPEGEAPRTNLLDTYVQRDQPSFRWELTGEVDLLPEVKAYQIDMVSQTWRGMQWTHRLNVVVPPAATGERARTGHAILVITGSGGEGRYLNMLAGLALRLGVPVAVLHDVPNQPLFSEVTPDGRGMREDALIAYTFAQFFQTGDADWPLLFPMARSVVSAFDALGEFSEQRQQQDAGWGHGRLESFITTGASKRGWTTWLSAVVDQRVIGIAPIVYDNLNMPAQIEHHMRCWGAPSPSIHDYTDAGLLDLMEHPRSRELMLNVDPYTYADRITVPKLICIGTNDSYWPVDAIQIYRNRIPGQLYCHYVPNAGHGAGLSVVDAVAGFFDHVTERTQPMPVLSLEIDPREGAILRLDGDATSVRAVRLWGAHREDRDFRESSWVSTNAAAGQDGAWRATLPEATQRADGNAAFLGEVELIDSAGQRFLVHTPVQVWELGPQE